MATTKTDTYEAGRQAARLHLEAKDYTEVYVAKRRAAAHEEAGRKDVAAYWHGYALEITLAKMKRTQEHSMTEHTHTGKVVEGDEGDWFYVRVPAEWEGAEVTVTWTEPHYRNHEATAEETALIDSLREEAGHDA